MVVFGKYSDYYDLLYRDKDYQKECNYLKKVFKKYSSHKVKTILDLGCGTGNHSIILAEKGYQLTGIDFSPKMLQIAKEKAKQENHNIDFHNGDIRCFNLGKKFDATVSMFAVMGYQTANIDFEATLFCINKHLKTQGLFIFDVWFGSAVLADKPKNKTKKVKLKNGYLIRQTRPRLNLLEQTVNVRFETKHYTSSHYLQKTNLETHKMRFFFYQELLYFLQKTGFKPLGIFPFLKTKSQPSGKDWNISIIARKLK